MKKCIILILISNRTDSSIKVQDALTEYGCNIRTRLGLHQGVENTCSESGLIVLEMADNKTENEKLFNALDKINGVHVKIVDLEV